MHASTLPIGRPRQPGSVTATLPDAVMASLQSSDVGRRLLEASKPESLTSGRASAIYRRISERNAVTDNQIEYSLSARAVTMAALAADETSGEAMYVLASAYNPDRFAFMAALALCAPETPQGEAVVLQILRSVITAQRMPGVRPFNVAFPWTGLPDTVGNSRIAVTLALLDNVVSMQDLPIPATRAMELIDIVNAVDGVEKLVLLSQDTMEAALYTLNYTLPYTLFRADPDMINSRLDKAATIVSGLHSSISSLTGLKYPMSAGAAWHLLARMMTANDSRTVGSIPARQALYSAVMQATDAVAFGRVPYAAAAKKSGAKKKGADSRGRSTAPTKRTKAGAAEVEPQFDLKVLHIISDAVFNQTYQQVTGASRAVGRFPFAVERFSGSDTWTESLNGSGMFTSPPQHLLVRLAYQYPDEMLRVVTGLKAPSSPPEAVVRMQALLLAMLGSTGPDVNGPEVWSVVSGMFDTLPLSSFQSAVVVNSLVRDHWIEGNVATLAEYILAALPETSARSLKAVQMLGVLTKFLVRYHDSNDLSLITDSATGTLATILAAYTGPLLKATADGAILLANIGWLLGVESLRSSVLGKPGMQKLYMAGLETAPDDRVALERLQGIYAMFVAFIIRTAQAIDAISGDTWVQSAVFPAFVRDAIAMLAPAVPNTSMQTISESKLLDGQPTYPLLYVMQALLASYSNNDLARNVTEIIGVLHNKSGAVIATLQNQLV